MVKIKDINDYVDEVWKKHPELSREEVKRILVYGWKMILLYIKYGNDFSIIHSGFFFFIGKIPNSALNVYKNYVKKLSIRILYMFKRTNSEWDGYYYFARTENLYKEYLELNRKKYKVFKNVFLYKLLEECKVKENDRPYIFRLSEDKTKWFRKFYSEIKTDKAELIILRDALKMKDLLTSYNDFKYILL